MATKNVHEIYRGKAVIIGIGVEGAEDWPKWERAKLSEADAQNAFKIVYDVAEGDQHGERHDVKVEISHRELVGVMLDYYKREDGRTPTQIDVAIRTLVRQEILKRGADENSITDAVDDALCGREVFIRVYEEPKDDGGFWPARAAFCTKYQRLTGQAMRDRIAAFQSGKPAPSVAHVKCEAASSVIPSAPADDDDMPF